MNRFDQIIRTKLTGLAIEGTPDWPALQERLDGEAFDEHLRAALPSGLFSAAAFGDDAPASQWDALAERLDANSDLEDDAFDRLIAQRLNRVESALEPAESWRQLSRRMDTLWPLRRVLVRYRVPEIAAAALLLFTFLPLLRDNATLHWLLGEEMIETVSVPVAPFHELNHETAIDFGDGLTSTDEPSVLDQGSVGLPGVLSPSEIAALLALHDRVPGQPASDRPTAVSRVPGLAALSELWQRLTETPLPPASMAAVPRLQNILPTASTSSVETDRQTPKVLPLSLKELSGLSTALPNLALPKSFDPRPNWQYGVSGGLSVVHVVTPSDFDFEVSRRVQQLIVPQIGMQATYLIRPRVRIGLSASILSVGYDPGLPEVTRARDRFSRSFGYTEDFRNISVDLLRTSSDLHVGLRQPARRMQVWVKAGVGTQFAMRTNYDIQRAPSNSGAQGVPFANPETQGNTTSFGQPQARPFPPLVRSSTPSDVKDFSDGVLQGGSFRENRQFFGRVGAEAEWKIGNRLRVFGSLDVDASLPGQRGFGPNRDRFYSVASQVGARVNL